MNIKPMLISEYPYFTDYINKQSYVFIQPKLDGWRAIYDKQENKFYTRNGNEIKTLPHLNESAKIAFKNINSRYIDGEIYKHGMTLGEIQSGIKSGNKDLEFHVFDFIKSESYSKRSKLLSKIKQSEHIKIIKNIVSSPAKIMAIYQQFIDDGCEGAIVRIDGIIYEQKRSENIFKIKPVY